jgi:arginase
MKAKKCVFLGAPVKRGQELLGPERAPAALRNAGLFKRISETTGYEVVDLGDSSLVHSDEKVITCQTLTNGNQKVEEEKAMHARDVSLSCGRIAEIVEKAAKNKDDFVLTVGGDHSIAMGTISGYERKNCKLG